MDEFIPVTLMPTDTICDWYNCRTTNDEDGRPIYHVRECEDLTEGSGHTVYRHYEEFI